MKRLFFLAVSIFSICAAEATTYYVSSSTGSDDRSPRQAQNQSTPWKSLDKLNSFFTNLEPGDAVLLKRGDTYYGSINISKSGSGGSPITIGAYGTGKKPVITSLVTLTGWSANKNNKGVYESAPNTTLGSVVNTILLNGVAQELGRFPNSDAANKGYLTIKDHDGLNSITGDDMSSNTDWTGAQLALRTRRWVIDRDSIMSQSGNTIFYKAASKYQPYNKYGYFIQNSVKTLDKTGEWYYNPATKQVTIFLGRSNPSSFTVQAAAIDNLISSSGNSNITFDGLQIQGPNVCGFFIKNGSNISIKNCDVLFSGRDGIKIVNHKNADIENCTVANSNNNGIDFGFNGSDNATIRNNKILNTAVFAGMTQSGDGKGLALQSNGNGSTIEYNEIRNTAYSGMYFNGNNVTVKNNFVDSFCITRDDGGGIYTYTGTGKGAKSNRKIIGNIVINGIGASQGTNDPKPAAEGIYLDNNTADVQVTDNTIAHCSDQGIFLQCAHEITIQNNTIFNSGKKQLAIIELENHAPVRNCVVTNNTFFSTQPSQSISYLKSYSGDVSQFGKFDNNFYVRPPDNDNKGQDMLDKLKVFEANAKISNFNNSARFEYNPTNQNKTITLDGNYVDVQNNSYSNRIVLKPYSSVILMKQGGGRKFG